MVKGLDTDSIISIIFGVISLISGIIFYILQRKKKSLYFEIVYQTQIACITDIHKNKLNITLDYEMVPDIQLLEIKFTNNGNIPIKPEDYYEPISISVPNNCQILIPDIFPKNHIGLHPNLLYKDTSTSCIILSPILINPGESFNIKIYVINYYEKPKVVCRITGIKNIPEKKKFSFTSFKLHISHTLIVKSLMVVLFPCVFIFALAPIPKSVRLLLIIFFTLLNKSLLTQSGREEWGVLMKLLGYIAIIIVLRESIFPILKTVVNFVDNL